MNSPVLVALNNWLAYAEDSPVNVLLFFTQASSQWIASWFFLCSFQRLFQSSFLLNELCSICSKPNLSCDLHSEHKQQAYASI